MTQDNIRFTKKIYGEKQFQYTIRKETLPQGFIDYHSANFCEYFGMERGAFQGKRLLDTGCGPGKHAAVLALMGADVTGMDLSGRNLKKGLFIKEAHNLDNLTFVEHNLMNPVEELGTFELISAHNWMQHSEIPAQVLKNLVDVLEPGGRIYLSLYLAGTFRFYIAQIARTVLRQEDYDLAEQLVRFHFPQGFKVFDNYLDIYLENIFDDFFVPFCHWTSHDIIVHDAALLGLKPISEIPRDIDLADIDNRFLRVGFEKIEESDCEDGFLFTKPTDEFENGHPAIRKSSELAKAVIKKYAAVSSEDRVSFCLGLYRLRAELNKLTDVNIRHEALQFYLSQALDETLWPISVFND